MTGRISIPALHTLDATFGGPHIATTDIPVPVVMSLVDAVEAAQAYMESEPVRPIRPAAQRLRAALARFDFGEET